MFAALAAVPTATDAITLPLVLTVAFATAALVAIAVYIRRARRTRQLTGVVAAASGITAVGVLVSAVMLSLTIGGGAVASANDTPATAPTGVVSPSSSVVSDDLGGFQLPTE
jgi:hypothetical protein